MSRSTKLLMSLLMFLCLWAAGCGRPKTLSCFTNWPSGSSPIVVGTKVADNMLPRWKITRPSVHYAEDSTWVNALKFAQLTGDETLKTALIKRFDPFLTKAGQKNISMRRHVDHNIFGIVPLELYIQTGDKRYLKIGKMLADRQWDHPDANGLSGETRFWIDDMYMITMLQMEAFRATQDTVYLDRASREMVAYLDKLQRPNGLFYHGPKFPFFWGRGNGWVAAGMTEMLLDLPSSHPRYQHIMTSYRQMMQALLHYQGDDGMWHQLIDHPESYEETSCTGMFTYALITGVKKGWLKDPAYGQAARKGWIALTGHIDKDGNVDQVCVGTGQSHDVNYYLNRPTEKGNPHGQAPVLWCAVALLR